MHFKFTDIQSRNELSQLIDFLHKQNLNYPNYDDWIQRTESEIDLGYKNTILAFSNKKIVGDLIYQQHKTNSRFLELKNMRVLPELKNRYFAKFMLRQAEAENQKYDAIICDAPSEFPELISFMQGCGYTPILSKPLYDDQKPEIVMIKPIQKSKNLIITSALNLF
jgi:hypothetical protein